jgi:hypothetical protein
MATAIEAITNLPDTPTTDQFVLTDLPAAVTAYLQDEVTVTLDPIDPAVTGSLQPGELGTFGLHVTNGSIALEEVWIHLTFENNARADFQVPAGAAVFPRDAIDGNSLTRNSFVNEMFLQFLDGKLEADDTIDLTLTIKAGNVGESDLQVHVHADVPISSVIPTRRRGHDSVTPIVVE